VSDDDANYVLQRTVESSDIEEGERQHVRAEAPEKDEVKELFDHAAED